MENDKNRNYGQSDHNSQHSKSQNWANSNEEANEPINNAGRAANTSERFAQNSRDESTASDENRYQAAGQHTDDENSWRKESSEEDRRNSNASVQSGTNPDRYQNLGKDMNSEDESGTRKGADRSNENNSRDEMRTPGL